MKIAIAQLNFHVGNFEYNFNKIKDSIQRGREEGAQLVIFSELSVCGYAPHDLFEKKDFFDKCQHWLQRIAELTEGIAVIVGCPSLNPSNNGKKLFNSAVFIQNKQIISLYHKALLPAYDVFDEYRYFEPGNTFQTISCGDKKIGITICEDLWDFQPVENDFGKSHLYQCSPMEETMKLKPDFIVNISASPFENNKIKTKREIFSRHAKNSRIPIIYVNQVGANTELIFDGGSQIYNSFGELISLLNFFEEDFFVFEDTFLQQKSAITVHEPNNIGLMHDALVLGIKDYFEKSGLKKAIIGLSGGIDSAIVCYLAVAALGNENVRVLLMPSQYSSLHSVGDAVKLAENLQIQYDTIGIQSIFKEVNNNLAPLFSGNKEDVTEENIQARIRGILLMAVSNKKGNLLLNTTNKSEMAVGYGTLYGDMNGALSVIGDVYKKDVYKIAEYINREKEIIPHHTIIKPPSAELRPNQKDSDSLPDYDVLDGILFQYIELQRSAEEIIRTGYDGETVYRIIKMVNYCEYKRFQAPPVLRVSSKAFGFGRRLPLVAQY